MLQLFKKGILHNPNPFDPQVRIKGDVYEYLENKYSPEYIEQNMAAIISSCFDVGFAVVGFID
jgi:hypothetical protein